MPRIPGVGYLDWSFPRPCHDGIPEGKALTFWVYPDRPFALPRRELANFHDGKYVQTPRSDQSWLGDFYAIPPSLLEIARRLSLEYQKVSNVFLVPEVEVYGLSFCIRSQGSEEFISRPTNFIMALARKMAKWRREFEEDVQLKKAKIWVFLQNSLDTRASTPQIANELGIEEQAAFLLLLWMQRAGQVRDLTGLPGFRQSVDKFWQLAEPPIA